jgi:hypothetical protein
LYGLELALSDIPPTLFLQLEPFLESASKLPVLYFTLNMRLCMNKLFVFNYVLSVVACKYTVLVFFTGRF